MLVTARDSLSKEALVSLRVGYNETLLLNSETLTLYSETSSLNSETIYRNPETLVWSSETFLGIKKIGITTVLIIYT